jgi:hypothetical protein
VSRSRSRKPRHEEQDWSVNKNQIVTDAFSCRASQKLLDLEWPGEPEVLRQRDKGFQCDSCSSYVAFNRDWGLCSNSRSRHYLETVFEHFTCPSYWWRRTQDDEYDHPHVK